MAVPDRENAIEAMVDALNAYVYYFDDDEERRVLARNIWAECWGAKRNPTRYRIAMFPAEVIPVDALNQPLPARKAFRNERDAMLFFMNLAMALSGIDFEEAERMVRIYRTYSFRVGNVFVECHPFERGHHGDLWWCMDVHDITERSGSTGECVAALRELHERVGLLESMWLHERVSGLERRLASRL